MLQIPNGKVVGASYSSNRSSAANRDSGSAMSVVPAYGVRLEPIAAAPAVMPTFLRTAGEAVSTYYAIGIDSTTNKIFTTHTGLELYYLPTSTLPSPHEADLVSIVPPALAAHETIDSIETSGATWLLFVNEQFTVYDNATPHGKIWRSSDQGATWDLIYSTVNGYFRFTDLIGIHLVCGTYLDSTLQTPVVNATGPVDVIVCDDITAASPTFTTVYTDSWKCTAKHFDAGLGHDISDGTPHHVHSTTWIPNLLGVQDFSRVWVAWGDGTETAGALAAGQKILTRGVPWTDAVVTKALSGLVHPSGTTSMVVDGQLLVIGNESPGTIWPQVLGYSLDGTGQKMLLNIGPGNETHATDAPHSISPAWTYAPANGSQLTLTCRNPFISDGLIYAPMYRYGVLSPGAGPGLWVSPDHGTNWVCVWKVLHDDGQAGVYNIIGKSGNYLITNTQPASGLVLTIFKISPVTIVNSVRIDPVIAVSNGMLTANVSEFGNPPSVNGAYVGGAGAVANDAAVSYDGNGSLRFTPANNPGPVTSAEYIYGPRWGQPVDLHGIPVAAGDHIFLRMKVKTGPNWPYNAYILVAQINQSGAPNVTFGPSARPLSTNAWNDVWVEGTAAAGIGDSSTTFQWSILVVYPYNIVSKAPDCVIWIDDVQISRDQLSWYPLSYQVGGTNRTLDEINLAMVGAGTDWSQQLIWRPNGPGWASIGANLPIATICDANGDYVEIYWSCADYKIYAKVAGVAAIAGPAAVKWHQHDIIQLLYVSPPSGNATLYTSDPLNGVLATTVTNGALPNASVVRIGVNLNAGVPTCGVGYFSGGVLYRYIASSQVLSRAPTGIDELGMAGGGVVVI